MIRRILLISASGAVLAAGVASSRSARAAPGEGATLQISERVLAAYCRDRLGRAVSDEEIEGCRQSWQQEFGAFLTQDGAADVTSQGDGSGGEESEDPGNLRPSPDAKFDAADSYVSNGDVDLGPDGDQEPVEDFDLASDEMAGLKDRAIHSHRPVKNEFSVDPFEPEENVALAKPSAPTGAPTASADPVATIANASPGAVLVELPVLAARSKAAFDGHPFWLVVEVVVGGKKVSEWRQEVTADVLLQTAPTWLYMKTQIPVAERVGAVELRVFRVDGDGSKVLFTRKLPYGGQTR
jgi:hypothetical protein